MGVAERHNSAAPYWGVLFIVTLIGGLSTLFVSRGGFWKGYVLDATGPAWNYILFRCLSMEYVENAWTRLMTPIRTFTLFVAILFTIESAQYLGWYESTFDPWDFVAYVALLLPMFVIDLVQHWSRGIELAD